MFRTRREPVEWAAAVYLARDRGRVTVMTTREVVSLYDQSVTGFELNVYIRPEPVTDGDRAEMPERMRGLLGYFYRERTSVVP